MEEREKKSSSAALAGAPGLVSRLKAPLEFAAARDFARLAQLKDLEPVVRALAGQARELPLPPAARKLVERIEEAVKGFDTAPPERRRQAVEDALALVARLEAAVQSPSIQAKGGEAKAAAPKVSVTKSAPTGLAPDAPVSALKGVGPALAVKLSRLGVEKAADLLYLLPRRYEDFRNLKRIAELVPGETAVVKGTVLAARMAGGWGRGKRSFEAALADETGTVTLKYFQFSLERLKRLLAPGRAIIVAGEVGEYAGRLQIIHPEVFEAEGAATPARIRPVYPATEGLLQGTLRRLAAQALPLAAQAPAVIPEEMRARLGLPSPAAALHDLHAPEQGADIAALNSFATPAHRALIFEELFLFQLGLLVRRRARHREPGIAFPEPAAAMKDFAAALPYRLTAAQERVLAEIAADMNRPEPMNRLVQGDVGCGKTAVALAACLACARAGYQAALMAPTEILAEQHLRTVSRLPQVGLAPVLVTSRLKRPERREALRRLREGEANLAIGTHAIIEEGVEFARLGLAVVDEQHRFGVMQRSALLAKGAHPDVLVMSATPIPRSLALTIYGDLDLSIVDELPPGRSPVKTLVLGEERRGEALSRIRAEVSRGGQAYVVYPLVEESEKLALKSATSQLKELGLRLPGLRLGLIHGRLEAAGRDSVLAAFARGEIDVLVATTVIEVGIDVPNASLMLVEHAERFGLSQLHQLRGRVGRGERPATCLLLTDSQSEQARRRLAVMEGTNDGFRIAEADLELRGPGEFLGVRQSGLPGFRVADVLRDARLLVAARREAERFLNEGGLKREGPLRRELARRWGERLRLVGVG
jgi:ATP-dependent DNA helicase RecG